MKKFLIILSALAFVAGLAACKHVQIGPKGEGEYVFAESLVPYNEINLKAMKQEGIAAAQKAAVEKVAGVFISSSTTVDHSRVVENQIVAKSQGFIRKYHAMQSYRKGDEWFTKIKAMVLVTDISNVIKQSEESTLVKKTNIMVASREVINDEVSFRQDCKQAVYSALRNEPYYLMNGDNLSEKNIEDPVGVIDKARYEGARFIVIADAHAAPLNMLSAMPTPFKTYRASVNMRVLSTRNYAVVATASSQQSGLDPMEEIAAQKAITAACEMAAKDIMEPLKSAVNSARTYALIVQDVNTIDRLRDLQNILKEVREIEDFNLIKYTNSTATFEVQTNIKSVDELAAKIIRQYRGSFDVPQIGTKEIKLKMI